MGKFLLTLLIPTLLVIGLNWRLLYGLAQIVFFEVSPSKQQEITQAADSLPDNTLSIPVLRLVVPVVPSESDPTEVADWSILKKDLTKGVSLARKLPVPGEIGTSIITGHSSDWTPHQYSAVFAGLHEVEAGQPLSLRYGGATFHYQIKQIKTVSPQNLDYFKNQLQKTEGKHRLALVTCTPLFSTAKRLVVIAELAP